MAVKITLFNNSDEYQVFSAGQTVFKQDEPGDAMYAVLEGEVEILVNGKVLETTGPETIIGEMSLIDTTHRSATAVAKTDCKLVPINQKRFLFLVQNHPFFSIQIMQIMTERLRQMNAKM